MNKLNNAILYIEWLPYANTGLCNLDFITEHYILNFYVKVSLPIIIILNSLFSIGTCNFGSLKKIISHRKLLYMALVNRAHLIFPSARRVHIWWKCLLRVFHSPSHSDWFNIEHTPQSGPSRSIQWKWRIWRNEQTHWDLRTHCVKLLFNL